MLKYLIVTVWILWLKIFSISSVQFLQSVCLHSVYLMFTLSMLCACFHFIMMTILMFCYAYFWVLIPLQVVLRQGISSPTNSSVKNLAEDFLNFLSSISSVCFSSSYAILCLCFLYSVLVFISSWWLCLCSAMQWKRCSLCLTLTERCRCEEIQATRFSSEEYHMWPSEQRTVWQSECPGNCQADLGQAVQGKWRSLNSMWLSSWRSSQSLQPLQKTRQWKRSANLRSPH